MAGRPLLLVSKKAAGMAITVTFSNFCCRPGRDIFRCVSSWHGDSTDSSMKGLSMKFVQGSQVAVGLALCLWGLGCTSPSDVGSQRSALSSISVLTRNYNEARTGANLDEQDLNTSTVNSATFGKLFNVVVDDEVYAGVLYVANLSIAGGVHNVLYVATVNNSVYAFDADTGGSALWQVNLNNGFRPPFHLEVGCYPYKNFQGNIGIVGTPVIDAAAGRMFLVTRTVENGTFRQRLHALDIATGNQVASPRVIGTIHSRDNNQRAGLALSQGKVFVSWASHCDTGQYKGYVIGYNTNDLSEAALFDASGPGSLVGIWMAGAAPIVDGSGNLIYATGNGTSNPSVGAYGQSIVKLTPSLTPLDYFIPANFASLNAVDDDLGSSGPVSLPGTSLIAMGGKGGGTCYLVDTNNMGHTAAGDAQIRQKWQCGDPNNVSPGQTHHFHNTMVSWNSPAGLRLYSWSENDFGRAWRFNGSTLDVPAVSVTEVLPPLGMPGGVMSISANGSTPGSGVLWVSMPLTGDASESTVPGVLRAFDAEDLTRELWNSAMVPFDTINNLSKGSPPVVANGKVYMASLSGIVSVFGLRPAPGNPDRTEGGTASGTGTPCNAVNEGPAKLYDNNKNTKWCVSALPSTSNPISTAYDFAGTDSYIITGYTITTANDLPGRDPLDWTFQGCQGSCTVGSDSGWVTLDTRVGQFFGADRFQSTFFAVSNSAGYQQYRLRFTANHGDVFGSFQIADVQMFGTAGMCSPESDAAFCSRLGKNCGMVTANDNCGAPRTVGSCGACNAPATCGGGGTSNVCGIACSPESDAAFCSRLGKNCGMVTANDNCGAPRTVGSCGACTAPATCGGGGTANVCGGSPSGPDLTEGGTATSTGTACSAGESVAQAYDNLMTPSTFSKWCILSAPSSVVPISAGYRFSGTSAYVVTSYSVTTGNDEPDRDPRDWTLQGCQGGCVVNSDAGWVTLDARTGQFIGAGRYQTSTYPVANANAFRQYRLRITANGGVGVTQLAEIQLFGDPGACLPETDAGFCARTGKNCGTVSGTDDCGNPRTVTSCGACNAPETCGGAGTANVCGAPPPPEVTEGGTATGTGTACNVTNENVSKAYDNRMTSTDFSKWCVTSAPTAAAPISTVYDFAGSDSYVVTSYAITTANDAFDRDPTAWTFQGCQGTCTAGSDTGWVTLDTRSGQFATAGRYQTATFSVSNSAAYQQYRLRFTANRGAASLLQMAEIQMFGTTGACTPESDPTFCSRLGKNCGTVSGTDNCGAARTVSSCGTCTAPNTCGGGGTANVCGFSCTPESDPTFCSRLGKNCGTVSGTDNCGAARTVSSCGTCTAPNTCGGGGTANVCGFTCTPESDPTFCSRLGKNCGTVSGTDNCGAARTVSSCGTCTAPNTCGGGGTANVCGFTCTPESDPTFCSRLGKNCGTVSGTDNCGAARTVSSCGTCTAPDTCGGAGTANVCGFACTPESDPTFCSRLGKNCGTVSGTDNCGAARTVSSCGTCTAPNTCGGGGIGNVCGVTGADVTEGGTATSTGTICIASESAAQAYDNLSSSSNSTKWCVLAAPSTGTPISTVYDFAGGSSYVVTSYTITSGNDAPERDPRAWTFQGCTGTCTVGSDVGWVTLDTRTNEFSNAARFQTNTYAVANSTPYQKYRLRITAGNGSPDLFQLGEIQMFGAAGACLPENDASFCARLGKNCGAVSGTDDCGSPRTVTSCGSCTAPNTCGGGGTANVCGSPELTEGGTATGTGTACNSSTEGVSKIYDNLMTSASFSKWCVTSAPSTGTPISAVYDFAGTAAPTVTSYTITSANDFPDRDPRDWTLQGCQGTCTASSNTGWVTVDTRTGQFAGAGRFQTNTYSVATPGAYQQYRLRVTAANGSSNRFQVTELQLFGN
jgi:hypothetical protein